MEKLTGLIVKAVSGFYYVEADGRIYECKARGVFRKKNIKPCVGDTADIVIGDDKDITVENIHPRKNSIIRPPIANLDRLFITASMADPAPNTLIIDKITAVAISKGIEPVVVFTKSDLDDSSNLVERYTKAGIQAMAYSIIDESHAYESREKLMEMFRDRISAFTGNTGAGKSSLLNSLFPELSIETGEISKKLGRGRHTTRHSELYRIGGGYVADTPGFSTVDIERYEMIEKDQLQYCFPEFRECIQDCRFTGCSHVCEKGCAVIEAVSRGDISRSRHENYKIMYEEITAYEKRRQY